MSDPVVHVLDSTESVAFQINPMNLDELLVLYLHNDDWEEEDTKPYEDHNSRQSDHRRLQDRSSGDEGMSVAHTDHTYCVRYGKRS